MHATKGPKSADDAEMENTQALANQKATLQEQMSARQIEIRRLQEQKEERADQRRKELEELRVRREEDEAMMAEARNRKTAD